jgi:hypothetical protein
MTVQNCSCCERGRSSGFWRGFWFVLIVMFLWNTGEALYERFKERKADSLAAAVTVKVKGHEKTGK